MRLRTEAGDLPFRLMTFPDGQRHFELLNRCSGGFGEVTMDVALTSADAIFDVLLAKNVLDLNGYITKLNIRYLLGARMDRRINATQPFTLEVVARMLNGAGFQWIRILDQHSKASCELLNAQAVYPTGIVARVLDEYLPSESVILIPDKGAEPRVLTLLESVLGGEHYMTAQCHKKRDSKTGALSGFGIDNASLLKGKRCLILDDICDGGGTFSGLAQVALSQGFSAKSVDLFVTHGIFSKGLPLDNIDTVYTTDSYPSAQANASHPRVIVFPFEMEL